MRPHGGGSGTGSRVLDLDAFGRANALIVPRLAELAVAVRRAGWRHVQFADSSVVGEHPITHEAVTFGSLAEVVYPDAEGGG